MNTEISPAELVLAVTGVGPIISKAVEKFSKADLDQATAIPALLEKRARQLCMGELEQTKLYQTNYTKTLKDLFEGYNQDQVTKMVASFSKWVPGIQMSYMTKASEVIQYLQNIFPRQTFQTFLGSNNLVPSDLSIYQFESVLEVLDDPTKVFALIGNGSLTKRQTEALRAIYPTFSQAVDEALITITADFKAKKASFELPAAAEIGVNRWFGQPGISPKLAANLKAVTPADPNKSPPKGQPSTVAAKDSLSSAQRAMYPQATK